MDNHHYERHTKRLGVRVRPSLWEAFAAACKAQGQTITQAIINLMNQFVNDNKKEENQ